jgi:hypothetical protein
METDFGVQEKESLYIHTCKSKEDGKECEMGTRYLHSNLEVWNNIHLKVDKPRCNDTAIKTTRNKERERERERERESGEGG